MSRCHAHHLKEPCFYCERGLPPFENLEARLEMLELRVRELELYERTMVNLDRRKTNFVIRMGGVGDLVMLSSSLKALKEKEPLRPIVLATKPENIEVLSGAEYLDGLIPVGNMDWGQTKFYRRYDLRYAVEPPGIGPGKLSWADYTTRDRSDIFDELLGVKSSKNFSLPIDQDIQASMRQRVAGLRYPLIGIAPTSKSPVRAIPPEYVKPLIERILKKYRGTVVLFGKTLGWSQHLAKIQGSHILNLIDALSLPEMIALCSLLDVVIAPDTGTTHVAGALGVKCLALFGNIDPKTRVTYYPSVKSLYPYGEMSCIPCWDKHDPCEIPRGQFGAACMRLLTPERIVNDLGDLL